jgi:hypothetical protein
MSELAKKRVRTSLKAIAQFKRACILCSSLSERCYHVKLLRGSISKKNVRKEPMSHYTRVWVRGWGSPNSNDWRKSLALCLLCESKCVLGDHRWHRIQIRMFLGLPDPDPLVRGTDPDLAPDRIRLRILPFSHRCVEMTEIMPAK